MAGPLLSVAILAGCAGEGDTPSTSEADAIPAPPEPIVVTDSRIDFRGTGNEPGWHVEIRDDLESRDLKRIRFVYDYGEGEAVLHGPEPAPDPEAGSIVYAGENGDATIRIEIEAARCADTMSDETFGATVTVEFQGRVYHGCGDWLNGA
jgi:uncharacterized membrane protein